MKYRVNQYVAELPGMVAQKMTRDEIREAAVSNGKLTLYITENLADAKWFLQNLHSRIYHFESPTREIVSAWFYEVDAVWMDDGPQTTLIAEADFAEIK